MARYGFTGELNDTKFFLMFILRQCPAPITRDELQSIALMDENADYFIYCQALAELIEVGLFIEDESHCILSTPRAREHADTMLSSVPFVLRRESLVELKPILERMERERLEDEAIAAAQGGHYVTLDFSDHQSPLLEMRIATGSADMSKKITRGWNRRPSEIYQNLINDILRDDERAF